MPPRSDSEVDKKARATRATWIKQARQLHLYLGIFFAPSIIFFALSGSLQLFGLHEGHPGESYQPPAWIEKLGSIHKNQTLAEKHGPPSGSGGEERRPAGAEQGRREEDREQSKSTLVLKWFFLAMALGLIVTTFLGIYMAFHFNRSRTLVWSLLIGGVAIPVAVIAMMA